MRTVIIYHKDGSKTELSGARQPRESYESIMGDGKDFHEHLLECNRKAEASGALDRMSHRERQYIRDVHTWAQQPGWWK